MPDPIYLCTTCRRPAYTTASTEQRYLCDACYRVDSYHFLPAEAAKDADMAHGCLHRNCATCGGTGQRKDGLGACVHMISCPCPRCTPRF
jgi:hypothetical protein